MGTYSKIDTPVKWSLKSVASKAVFLSHDGILPKLN
jgi:hypothetical protein